MVFVCINDQHDRARIAIRLMPTHPQIPTAAAFAWRLALFYAALCMVLGVQMPFLPVWFTAKGLDPAAIGLALAIPSVVRLFAIPIATRIADRHDATRAVMIVCSMAAVIGYASVGFAPSSGTIMAAVALASCFYTPLMTLADAYALPGLRQHGKSYGPVRSWGSAAYIAGTLGGGLLLDLVAETQLIWAVVGVLIVNAAAAAGLGPLGRNTAEVSAQRASVTALLRDIRLLAMMSAAALIQASHAVYYGFSALQWQAAGLGGMTIGALWALGVLAEIVLFAVSARLPLNPLALLFAGAAGAVLRWGAMAFDPPPALLLILQCLHALSFGATHLGALGAVVRAAPAGLGASAQGYLAVVLGLVMAVAMGVSGALYARWGVHAYAAMALLAALGAAPLMVELGRAGVRMRTD
jgi:PPP family 3-phenylpropionic acid transporter